jgi:hypothetical protein
VFNNLFKDTVLHLVKTEFIHLVIILHYYHLLKPKKDLVFLMFIWLKFKHHHQVLKSLRKPQESNGLVMLKVISQFACIFHIVQVFFWLWLNMDIFMFMKWLVQIKFKNLEFLNPVFSLEQLILKQMDFLLSIKKEMFWMFLLNHKLFSHTSWVLVHIYKTINK